MRSVARFLTIGFLLTVSALSPVQGQVTFTGSELLGRPTSHSITVNVVASTAIEAYFRYGTAPGMYTGQTSTVTAAANAPLEVVIANLQSNTRYYYRTVYRQTGTSSWISRTERTFHTQRAQDSTFTFTMTADSHVNIVFGNTSLYQQTLRNVEADRPDFHLDLGDTFAMDNVTTQTQARSAYLNQRPYWGLMSHSSPLFLVLGNHEQEEGWHLDDTGNPATSKPVLGANARKRYFLNPVPDDFYSGNLDVVPSLDGDHLAEDYYAWEWGDALFVAIDPYWYTTVKPFTGNMGGGESSDTGSGDRWDWTLGWTQYLWLKQTLENSTAKYKFIFAHHGTGGTSDYIREGANGAGFTEWGGLNEDGITNGFAARRPGWPLPVHQLLVDNHVSAFFHGHDHEFAYEVRDGVVYQLLPMAADSSYGFGSFQLYHEADPYTEKVLPNSGHLRVTVSPSSARVDYVRAFTGSAGPNGQTAYSYEMAPHLSGPPSLDLTPPTISNGQPGGVLPAGTMQATLRVVTNEAATCRYALLPGVTYGDMPVVFATTGGMNHASAVTGLMNGASYGVFVRCQDPMGNATVSDFPIAFSVAAPVPPATPGNPGPANLATGVATSAVLTWSAAGATSYDLNFGTTSPPPLRTAGLTSATASPTPMTASTTYFWQIVARNADGTTTGPIWSFTTGAVVSSPVTYGLTTIGSALDESDSNYMNGSLITTTAGGTAVSISAYVGAIDSTAGNRSYQVAIYTNSAGRPGTLVAKSASGTLTANSWNAVSLSATLQPNTSYWLLFNTNGRSATVNNMKYNVAAQGQGVYSTASTTFGTWPATFPSSTLTTTKFSLYVTVQP